MLHSMGPVAMLFEHIYGFLAEAKPGENVILSYEQMKDLGAITSNAIRLLGNASALLSKERRKAVVNKINSKGTLSSLASEEFSQAGKSLFGEGFKQGSRPDQRRQRPYFQLPLWGKIHGLLSFFEAASPPSEDEGPAGVVPVRGFQMPTTSASFGVHSEAGAELPGEPCSKSLQPPSREAFSFTTRYDVTFKSFSHKSPPPSRTPETLHFKLGDYKQRPLGLRNCSRVSSGSHKYPAPIFRPADSSSLTGEYGSYRPRNTTNARERSYPCGSPGRVLSRVCEFNFSSSQKRGWSETRRESPPPQSVHPLRTFQNGGDSYAEGSVKKRRLYGQDRPEGCIFHSASLEEPPKVSEVCLEGNNVRVCLPALRACKRPQSVHETYETRSRPVTPTGHKTDNLFRRHANNGSIQGHCPPTCLNCPRSFARVGLHDKLSEVSPSPFHKDGISRICGGLPHSVSSTSSGQNQERKKGMSGLIKPAISYSETTSQVTGTPYLYHSSCLSRAPPLPPLAKREKQGFSAFSNLRLCYSPFPSGQGGVGGLLQRSVHGGSVVSRGISSPHKLSRTSGGGICCQDLCERQSSNASPPVKGQFDCRPLHKHKQSGGTTKSF